ncbi:hypothetical protein CC80DRAFT_536208 [Byssothecium circinans]|uniref:WW domain-containing protein n=1 Tax=Byssothecium circinans TaxID=147558 RepID=A0A6A5TQK8_9PLEO|nr:hypothetical protein CC80DRAFT_536208 [Byssothecium circinans]
MDFLKKKMADLMNDEKKPEKANNTAGAYSHQQQYPQQSYPQQDYQHQNHPQQGYPQHQSYQQQGYPQQAYPQQQPYAQQGYGSPAPQGPPAPYGAPPPMPPGWVCQFDQNSQRWYYVDQATGRSQWDPPAHNPAPQGPYAPPPGPPAPGAPDERALFGHTQPGNASYYNNPNAINAYPSNNQIDPNAGMINDKGDKDKKDKKKDKGHSTAALAAVGIGGVAAGAWIGHELTEDSSDDEHKHTSHHAAPTHAEVPMVTAPVIVAPVYVTEEPPPVPTHDADGSSISSSDRESLEEKREELIEAQEEYEEELEEYEEEYGSD